VKIRTWNFLKEWYQNCWWSSAQISQKLSKFNVPKVILVLVILMIIKKSFVCSSPSCVVNWQWVYCKTCNLGQHWLIMGQTFMICNPGSSHGSNSYDLYISDWLGLVLHGACSPLPCPSLWVNHYWLSLFPTSWVKLLLTCTIWMGQISWPCTSLQLCGCP